MSRKCKVCGAAYEPRQETQILCGDAGCRTSWNRLLTRENMRRKRADAAAEALRRKRPPAIDTRQRVAGEPYPVSAPTRHVDREAYCQHYDDCLDVAVRMDWPGWSCRDCPIRGTCTVAPALPTGGGGAARMMIEAADPSVPLSEGDRKRITVTPGGVAWRNYRRAAVAESNARRRHGR